LTGEQRGEIERLFLQYGKGVGSYLLARVGDPELAEEITSRVFLAVVRHYGQRRGSAAAWLWAIVRSELARHYRRPAAALDGDLPSAGPGPPEELARRQWRQQLQAALDRLPAELHEIVYMKFFLDMRNLDIAAATGLSPSHVGVKVHRTLQQLRRLLQESPAGVPGEADR
jgi:RNA polymerase sigma-70 factor, ECF subfamily